VTPLAYTQSTVYEYRKTVVTYDTASQTTTSNNYVIDLATYNSTVQGSETVQFYDTNGNVTDTATYTVSTQVVYIYDWEVEQNESNRTINLINSAFVGDFEKQFKSLMSR